MQTNWSIRWRLFWLVNYLVCKKKKKKKTISDTRLLVDSTLAVPVSNINVFGEGSQSDGIFRVRCNGSEKNLLQCHNTPTKCTHQGEAGVHCYGNYYIESDSLIPRLNLALLVC